MNPNPVLVSAVPMADGTTRKILRFVVSAITGTTVFNAVASGMTSVENVVAMLESAPGVGAGDPFLATAEPNVPAAGQITVNVWQDNAVAATVPSNVTIIAIGT